MLKQVRRRRPWLLRGPLMHNEEPRVRALPVLVRYEMQRVGRGSGGKPEVSPPRSQSPQSKSRERDQRFSSDGSSSPSFAGSFGAAGSTAGSGNVDSDVGQSSDVGWST